MPVSMLLVEGRLDVEILTALLGGTPPVRVGGAKQSLAPRAQQERQASAGQVAYLRDRDFDHDPPTDLPQPVIDRFYEGAVLGCAGVGTNLRII